MMTSTVRLALKASVIPCAFAMGAAAIAEPAANRILSSQQTITKDGCVLMKISFNIRIRYVSHFPLERGDELRVSIRPIDPAQVAADAGTRRESIRPPDSRAAPVKAIDFETARADGPTLTIQFLRSVVYQVGPGADFESIVVAITDPRSMKPCRPVYPVGASGNWSTSIVRDAESPSTDMARPKAIIAPAALPTRSFERPAGKISATELNAAASAMDEARAALKKNEYATAVHRLTKVLRYPENQHSAQAQELLGIVYQKNKQVAEAKAEYEDYLRRYPGGEGADSVRQRLAAIETARMPREERLRASKSRSSGGDSEPGQTTWSVSGSASQFYIRDDSFRVVRDPSLPRTLNADKEDHRVHRNSVLSSLDLFGAWGNDQYKSKIRFSGTEEHRFAEEEKEIVGVSALYYETMVREWGAFGRFGRQSRNTGGVLGRFDGALVSWQASPTMKWNAVGGSPVASRRDQPFKDEKVFYGTSVDFGSFFGGLDISLFAIQQQVGDIVDRQAIGTELRYLDTTRSAFLTLDYDTHFRDFNAAIFSGSWTLPDKSTLNGGVDYRKAPYLTSWNALQGQRALTLFELLKFNSRSEIAQMAIDRTTTYTSANVGYTRPLTDKLQLNVDATAAHIDGTIASFGVDALPSTGNEFYYSAQLIASSLFRDGDTFTAGVRYADRQDSAMYVLDLGTRLPLSSAWRINPRVLMSYREGKTTDLTEYSVLPAVLLDYYMGKDLAFEMEVGAKRTWREQAGVRDNDTEFFFTVGYRYDFYADGKGKCPATSLACR